MVAASRSVGRPAEELDTPALLVNLPAMEGNIARMAALFKEAGVNWRPHTKGIKVPAIAHKLLAAGAVGITCAKLAEAEVMAAAGIRDILIANQIVGQEKVARLVALCRHADLTVVVDSVENVRELSEAACAKGVTLPVLIEVNVGTNRCGTEPGDPVVALAREISACPGLRFEGVMAWEGFAVRLEPDRKAREVELAISRLTGSADACRAAGMPVKVVNCGGTGDYWLSAHVKGVTEIEAGGGVFCDRYYQSWGVDHPIALTVLSTVVSRPTPTRVVTDAGRKAMSYDDHAGPWPKSAEGVKSVRITAEHGQFELDAPSTQPRIGEKLEWLVGYGDMTVCLHDEMYGVRDGVVETMWPILGRGKFR
jgi:D-serine deaminase-like pyridoxal phosphate-dependent protein